ncbi:MAG: hypothetical protein OXE87_16660 [Chloroflexi bacterium]|nr:hypothetical protein [Chloroflexota bacterium]
MTRCIITYDLKAPGRNYDELNKRIKSYGSWAQITESSWSVMTTQSAVQIRDHLMAAIDRNDKILVGILGTAAWYGLPNEASDRLLANT